MGDLDMQRGQLLAALTVTLVIGALLAVRLGRSTDPQPAPASSAVAAASPTPAPTGNPAPDQGSGLAAGPGASTPAGQPSPADRPPGLPSTAPALTEAPPRLGPAPELTQLDGWLQTSADDFHHFDGQVRIVQFWTFACSNCQATIPHLQGIYQRWQPRGLEIIGVHAPEFDFESKPDAIAAAAQRLGVTWPIALDTKRVNFAAWQPDGRYWPREVVIDQAGQIRFDHIGEGAYEQLEATVAYLIDNGPGPS